MRTPEQIRLDRLEAIVTQIGAWAWGSRAAPQFPRITGVAEDDPVEATARTDTQQGVLCFAGTRIPVQAIMEFAAAGNSAATIAREYPALSLAQIVATIDLAAYWAVRQGG